MFLHTACVQICALHIAFTNEKCALCVFVDVRADKQSIHFHLSLMGQQFLWGGFQLSISDLKQSAEQM